MLELTLALKGGVPAPDVLDRTDGVDYTGYYKPDPSASNEYFSGCDAPYVCFADFSASTPGVTRIRYTTYWGDKGDTILSPIGPVRIDLTAYFSSGGVNDPYYASYRILSVPEPAGWGLMLLGFGALGAELRRRRTLIAA